MERKLSVIFLTLAVSILLLQIKSYSFDFVDLKETASEYRAIAWVYRNSPEILLRIIMIELKMSAEYGYVDNDKIDEIDVYYNQVIKGNPDHAVEFGDITEDSYCLTIPAVTYIIHSIKSKLRDSSGEPVFKESAGIAAEAFRQNWYDGYIESEYSRNKMDETVKKYAVDFVELNKYTSEEEFKSHMLSLTKEQIKKGYLSVPMCSEVPLVEFVVDKIIDEIIFSD